MSSYLIFFFHLYNIQHNTLERVLNNRQIHIWIMGAITHILYYRRTSFMFCCCCEPYKIHWNFLFRRSTHYCNKLIISSKNQVFFSLRDLSYAQRLYNLRPTTTFFNGPKFFFYFLCVDFLEWEYVFHLMRSSYITQICKKFNFCPTKILIFCCSLRFVNLLKNNNIPNTREEDKVIMYIYITEKNTENRWNSFWYVCVFFLLLFWVKLFLKRYIKLIISGYMESYTLVTLNGVYSIIKIYLYYTKSFVSATHLRV